ncbi:HAD family hydrolase [Rubrivirga sp. IMCC43871]|uniref:HAD family hydrolase n=1 Tax=Rubrivirga sp. IMCC43871 TaxID=3391575 RepID=UPI00398FCFB5
MTLASPALVVFDLDDTLLDHRAAEAAALADVHRLHSAHLGHHAFDHVHASYRAANVPLWRDFGRGEITGAQLRQLRSERLLAALECDTLPPATLDRDYLARYAAHWRWAEGARAAYHAVADAVPVGILTNGFSAQQRGKLAALPEIAERAAFVVISEEVGVMKPDPGIFDHVREQAAGTLGRDVAASDLLYVGDSYHSDVLGGTGAGWPVAWYRGDPDRAPDGAVAFDDWADLLARIR